MYAAFIGAAFAVYMILGYVGLWVAKAVTITNGVYIMLAVVII